MEPVDILQFLLRYVHFVAGITWIGILYFFNLVNVNFMKTLDGPTKGKVIPNLMPAALWYFRWGAVFTVLSGLIYFAWIVTQEPDSSHLSLVIWLAITLVFWAIMYALIEVAKVNNGNILAAVFVVLVVLLGVLVVNYAGFRSSKSISIGIGGGIGLWMFLNVWGIIWRHQKRIIAWTAANASGGAAIPPESAQLGRRAFLASRTNAWLSLVMLFFMGTASHLALFG